MSPEQAEGIIARVDERTDVFALGAIADYGLTGRPPFAADSVLIVLARVCGEEPIPLTSQRPDVTPALAEVIGRAMAKRHDQRYPSAAAFATELRAALEDRLDPAALATAQGRTRGRAASPPVRRPPPRLSPSDPPAS